MNVIDSMKYYKTRLETSKYTGFAYKRISLPENPNFHVTIMLCLSVIIQMMLPMYFIIPALVILFSHEFVYRGATRNQILDLCIEDELELEMVFNDEGSEPVDEDDRWGIFETHVRPLKHLTRKRLKYRLMSLAGTIIRFGILYGILYVISCI